MNGRAEGLRTLGPIGFTQEFQILRRLCLHFLLEEFQEVCQFSSFLKECFQSLPRAMASSIRSACNVDGSHSAWRWWQTSKRLCFLSASVMTWSRSRRSCQSDLVVQEKHCQSIDKPLKKRTRWASKRVENRLRPVMDPLIGNSSASRSPDDRWNHQTVRRRPNRWTPAWREGRGKPHHPLGSKRKIQGTVQVDVVDNVKPSWSSTHQRSRWNREPD